ncbi:MAG: transglutaminase-like putative cysteine protease [Halioglobus sp.]|jgi:transglutaminase-like putative cysteine protease
MKLKQQIPRNALVWSVISMFALVVPHVQRLPIWVLLVYVFAAFWRSMVYRGSWSFPSRWVKFALIVLSFAGILLSYGNFLGLEPTVALLLTAFALKLIELAEKKDAYVLLFLGYFICVTEFLFSQDFLIVLYSVFAVVLITTALLALHQPRQHRFNLGTAKPAMVMLAQAFPLMLVLFFLFPRVGPLWTVPIKSHTAKTGVSDFMRPGDISNLSRSDDVAFRVQFEGKIPKTSELYWRGLVFSKLSEGAWRSLQYYDIPLEHRRQNKPKLRGKPLYYSIIMEPSQQNWLYSLRYPSSVQAKLLTTPDYRLQSPVKLEDEFLYQVTSWPDVVLDETLSDWRRRTETALPTTGNPQTRRLAAELRQEMGTDREFINAVLGKFNQENYIYTLQPPVLGDNPMDEFLFRTRRGFCEHYAYAFVLMMRAADIPARVVAGYQGGEINPVNKTVIVHQFDAHAWAEVWLTNEGWVRVDPTAAVSPDRIEWGLEQAMAGEGSFLSGSPLSPLRFRSVIWFNSLRLQYDALTYQWQSWVIGYNSETQYGFLRQWLGELDGKKYATILLGSWALILIPVAVSLLLRREIKRSNPADRVYLRFCRKLGKGGVVRAAGEAPGDFSARAAQALPAKADEINRITRLYMALSYRDSSAERSLLGELKTAVRRWRL